MLSSTDCEVGRLSPGTLAPHLPSCETSGISLIGLNLGFLIHKAERTVSTFARRKAIFKTVYVRPLISDGQRTINAQPLLAYGYASQYSHENACDVCLSRRGSGTPRPAEDLRCKSAAESRNEIHLLVSQGVCNWTEDAPLVRSRAHWCAAAQTTSSERKRH